MSGRLWNAQVRWLTEYRGQMSGRSWKVIEVRSGQVREVKKGTEITRESDRETKRSQREQMDLRSNRFSTCQHYFDRA